MIVTLLSSPLLLVALAADPGAAGAGCPGIEVRCACPSAGGASRSASTTREQEPICCAPGRADEAGEADAVPAVAHRAAAVTTSPPAAEQAVAPRETAPPARSRTRSGFSDWAIGAAAGLNFGGTLWLDREAGARSDHETDSAPAFLVYADAMTSRGVSVGGILYSTTLDGDFGDANLLGLGATLKGRFRTRSAFELRPGLLISYQKTDVDSLGGPVKGLGVGVLLDVATSLGDSFGLVSTLGLVGQPAGGNGEADLTFGPTFFWTGGFEFGN